MIVDENGMCTLSEEDRSYHSNYKPRPLTNADRIRAMTDEELAKMISGFETFALTCGGAWSPENWLEWLRRETAQNGEEREE